MKKIILAIVLTALAPAALSASTDAVDYGSAGQIEIRAGLSVSSSVYSDYQSIYTSINGGANYFLINNLYLGLNPFIGLGYYNVDDDYNDYSRFRLSSGLSILFGYIFPLSRNIYFDLSSYLSMHYWFSHSSNEGNEHIYAFTPGIQTSLKFKFNRILLHLAVSHNFIRYSNAGTFINGEDKGWQHSYYEMIVWIGASYSYIL